MQPFYIPVPQAELFAVYHEPRPGAVRRSAVLLCYPLGHEYLNAHRAYRQIATQLSAAGYPVLRFDYMGCGDSGGRSEQATVSTWLDNVLQAVAELRVKSRATGLCLMGVRFGATLALEAAARIGPVEGLVLWDPVVRGSTYLQELGRFHKRVLDRSEGFSGGAGRPAVYDGLSLFGFGSHLYDELEAIDVLATQGKPAHRVLLLESANEPESDPLMERLQQCDCRVERKHVPSDDSWRLDFDSLLLPGQAVPAVVRWVDEVCP